ncbi:MAG: YqkE family protein [Candidatus Pristimantibacillus sp.]
MSKKKRSSAPTHSQNAAREDKGPTLKDLLSADVLNQLKLQSDELKAAEEKRKQEASQKAEEARKQEQKRLENDMAYLLDNNKQDWRKFK